MWSHLQSPMALLHQNMYILTFSLRTHCNNSYTWGMWRLTASKDIACHKLLPTTRWQEENTWKREILGKVPDSLDSASQWFRELLGQWRGLKSLTCKLRYIFVPNCFEYFFMERRKVINIGSDKYVLSVYFVLTVNLLEY